MYCVRCICDFNMHTLIRKAPKSANQQSCTGNGPSQQQVHGAQRNGAALLSKMTQMKMKMKMMTMTMTLMMSHVANPNRK